MQVRMHRGMEVPVPRDRVVPAVEQGSRAAGGASATRRRQTGCCIQNGTGRASKAGRSAGGGMDDELASGM